MSIQSNFPTAKPSLLLDFANTKQLDPRITFTRASTANYYDGKTATLAEQNMFSTSTDFATGWTQGALSVTANTTTAPDGTTTADTLTEDSTNTWHQNYFRDSAMFGSGTAVTFSVYAKIASGNRAFSLAIAGNGGAAYATVVFDIVNGAVTKTGAATFSVTNSTISYVGNGWYRCSMSASYTAGVAEYGVINLLNTTLPTFGGYGNASYAGNGTSGIYFWGMQWELRSTLTAYTGTTGNKITNYIPTLQSAASGVARFDSNPTTGESLGLLIEESRTNIVLASSQFESPTWWKDNVSIAGNSIVAPDGTLSGDKVIPVSGSSGQNAVWSNSPFTFTAQAYTWSIYAKAGELNWIAFTAYDGSHNRTWFNLSTGVVGTNASGNTSTITSVGDGWYRCSVTRTASATSNGYFQIYAVNADNVIGGTNTGYSGIYIWGAQLEAGSSATSYVATPLTFTSRASSATYLGPNGYITSATTNTARNETNSVGTTNLLLESAASNLLQYTNDFENGYWTKNASVSVATNATQAPDGSVLADNVVVTGNGGSTQLYRVVTASAGSLTCSLYVKYISGSDRDFFFSQSGTTTNGIRVTLAADGLSVTISDVGSNVTSSGSVAVGGGWHRVYFTLTVSAGTFEYNIYRPSSYGSGNNTFSFWGAQAEAGSTATSYIPSVETWSSRASAAKYYNSSGVLTTAASGASRTTYNPALLGAGGKLLLENSATNLRTYSEQFDNAAWTKDFITATANSTTAPDGNTTADTLTPSTANNYHAAYNWSVASLSAQVYTASVYVKANGYNYFNMEIYSGSTNAATVFDLSSGTVYSTSSGTASIQFVGNGWYRCSVTGTTAAANGGMGCFVYNNSASRSYAGDGTSGVYVWGAQLEAGAGATSYITTTTATVTRAADTSTSAAQSRSADVYSASTVTRAADAASMTGTNFSSWFVSTSGTLYADYVTPSVDQLGVVVTLNSSSYYDNLGIWKCNFNQTAAGNLAIGVRNNSGGSNVLVNSGVSSNGSTRTSLTFALNNDLAISANNVAAVSNSTYMGGGFAPTYLYIGNRDGAYYTNGTIKKIAYYPQRLSNTNIQALTS